MALPIQVFVLNFNGRRLLTQCLPSLVAAAAAVPQGARLAVIDNSSNDGSDEYVTETWPDVRLIRSPNLGLAAFNRAVQNASEPLVVLVNNDVRVDVNCFTRLAETFERHADCFLAGPHCYDFDGKQYEGTRSALRFRRGLVHTELAEPRNGALTCGLGRHTASAGAILAVRRDRFLALGGFDDLFQPGRYEDLDLAFRGWLAGWRAYYVPEAVAYHLGRATFDAVLSRDQSDALDIRNALLFAWKNLRETRHVVTHVGFLCLRLLRAACFGQRQVWRGFLDAIRRFPDARARSCTVRCRTEREVFALLR